MSESILNRTFTLSARGASVGRELRGAIATFLTMAYILFVNPSILHGAGIDEGAAVACTALAAGVCCLLMGFYANVPLATAPGMGLNAFVVYTIAVKAGSWHTAMGVIVLDGLIMLVLVLAGLREAVMAAIPRDLRLATGVGIGLFIALLGLVGGGIVKVNIPDAPLQPGILTVPSTLVAIIGLVLTAALMAWRVPGAIVLGIIGATAAAFWLHVTELPSSLRPLDGRHLLALLEQKPNFSIAFHADVWTAVKNARALWPLLFAVLMVDFFDTLGTATAIGEQAGLVDADGRVANIKQILIVDSVAAAVGGALGVSSVTAYVESAAGVAEGARTGLHTVIVGVLFLLAIAFAPLIGVVPGAATAPALILVGFLIMKQVTQIDFTDVETAIPAFLILIGIPLTYSISHGIGYGFVAYVAIKLLRGKPHHVHWLMYLVAGAFVFYFITEKQFA